MWGGKQNVREFIDKTSTENGTLINREALMAIQGFDTKEIVFNADGSIVETNGKGETLTTVVESNGDIKQTFKGEKQITKITSFLQNGNIKEELQ